MPLRLLTYDFTSHRVDAQRGADGVVVTYVHDNAEQRRLNSNASGPFVRLMFDVPLPTEPGVYALTVRDHVVYVGRSRSPLRERGDLAGTPLSIVGTPTAMGRARTVASTRSSAELSSYGQYVESSTAEQQPDASRR